MLTKGLIKRSRALHPCVFLFGLLTYNCMSFGQSYLFNKIDFGVGMHPLAIVTADLNGDGKVDLATANADSGTVSVLLAKTNGTFKPSVDYAVGSWPRSVMVVDVNGDGRPDLVVANLFSNSVSILLGVGDGTFRTHVDYAAGSNPIWVSVGDVNHDGKLDLVTANETDNTVSILLGYGDGTFKLPVAYSAGNTPEALVAADFNGDGKLDIAVADHFGNSVSILIGKGDGTFMPSIAFDTDDLPDSIAYGDFNGDGKLDFVVGTDIGTVDTLLGNGDGTFQPFVGFGPGRNLAFLSIAPTDFNGDGKLDLAFATPNGAAIALGNGGGTFSPIVYYAAGGQPASVVAADFNGDSRPDLALANQECPSNPCNVGTVSVLLGNGDGSFMARGVYPTSIGPWSITNADLNGDNILDLVIANGDGGNTVSVYLGRPNGTFSPFVDYPAGGNPNRVIAADFRGIGRLDLAIPNYGTDTVSVLLNNGDGTFEAPLPYLVGTDPTSVAVGDFNHDGKLDLAVTTLYPSVVSILLGNGDGTFRPHLDYALAEDSFPNAIVTADFNGDKKLDLVAAETSGVSILLGNGDGTFQPFVNYTTGFYGSGEVTFGDFNNDGTPDLASTGCGAYSSGLSILLGNGDGTFQPSVSYSDSLAFGQVTTGDLNRDRQLDVAVGGPDDSLLLGNGDGTFQPALHILPAGFFAVTTGDFLRDGTLALAGFNGKFDPEPQSLIVALNRPVIGLFPTLLTYPTTAVGSTSGSEIVQVSNPGTSRLKISSIDVSPDFQATNNCPIRLQALAPGTFCTISVRFAPKTAGVHDGTVVITDNAPTKVQKVRLKGTGTFAQLLPPILTFEPQSVGTKSAPKNITLTNKGDLPLNITRISITGIDASSFSKSDNCGTQLAGLASCIIKVTFNPSETGKLTAMISVSDDGGGSPQTVSLIGTGK